MDQSLHFLRICQTFILNLCTLLTLLQLFLCKISVWPIRPCLGDIKVLSLSFLEFNWDGPNVWIRRAEKYNEMVGVPNEGRIKIFVMYTEVGMSVGGGTGCKKIFYHGINLCRIVRGGFNEISSYEIIGQFHNLKQTSSVVDYVNLFEELVGVV